MRNSKIILLTISLLTCILVSAQYYSINGHGVINGQYYSYSYSGYINSSYINSHPQTFKEWRNKKKEENIHKRQEILEREKWVTKYINTRSPILDSDITFCDSVYRNRKEMQNHPFTDSWKERRDYAINQQINYCSKLYRQFNKEGLSGYSRKDFRKIRKQLLDIKKE